MDAGAHRLPGGCLAAGLYPRPAHTLLISGHLPVETGLLWCPIAQTWKAGLAGVRQPFDSYGGERDPFGPPSAGEAACRSMPDAQLAALPAGHLPWVDEPDRCAAVVQGFIERLGEQAADSRQSASRFRV